MPTALTRDVNDTISARLDRDPEFREALVEETIARLRYGDAEAAKALARAYLRMPRWRLGVAE